MGQRPKLAIVSDPVGPNFPFQHIAATRPRPLMIIGSDGADDDDEDDSTNGSTVPVGRYLKMRTRMQAADRRASAAEAKVAELEPLAAKAAEHEKKVEEQTETIRSLRLDNAFLSSDIQWVDAEAALKLADLSGVTIADDGTVKGLDDALKALAEKKPFLVVKPEEKSTKKKRKAKDEDEDEEDDEFDSDEDEDDAEDEDEEDEGQDEEPAQKSDKSKSTQGGASGTSTGSGRRRRKGGKGPTDEELMRRYRI